MSYTLLTPSHSHSSSVSFCSRRKRCSSAQLASSKEAIFLRSSLKFSTSFTSIHSQFMTIHFFAQRLLWTKWLHGCNIIWLCQLYVYVYSNYITYIITYIKYICMQVRVHHSPSKSEKCLELSKFLHICSSQRRGFFPAEYCQ